jgi:hypothetical protein
MPAAKKLKYAIANSKIAGSAAQPYDSTAGWTGYDLAFLGPSQHDGAHSDGLAKRWIGFEFERNPLEARSLLRRRCLGELKIGERRPLAVFPFLLHQPLPGAAFRAPAERCVEGAVGILEDKLDLISVLPTPAQSFGEARSVDVQQVQDVLFADGIVAEKPGGFVRMFGFRRRCRCLFVDTEELVVQYPLGLNFVMSVVPHHLAGNVPCAGQVIDEAVLPWGRRLGDGGCGEQGQQR